MNNLNKYQINENSITVQDMMKQEVIDELQLMIMECNIDKCNVNPRHKNYSIKFSIRNLSKEQKQALELKLQNSNNFTKGL
jgi:hypothetical protein